MSVSARGQVVREHGEEAVLAALVLWLRARRWPLIPLRYYHRATATQTSTEPPSLQQLLARLPTRCAEQVGVVAREACQLIYLAPGVAGSGVEAMASILAPVRTKHFVSAHTLGMRVEACLGRFCDPKLGSCSDDGRRVDH